MIEMIIKGRNAHMRHLSCSHRVNLDWCLERQCGFEYFSEISPHGMSTTSPLKRDLCSELMNLFCLVPEDHFQSLPLAP